jgi:hypothetical protein
MPKTIAPDAIAAHAKAQRVSFEIAEAQLRYAAKPILVIWRDSHCSVPNRFDTLGEALDFVQHNWARIKARVASERYKASDLRWSYVEGPGFKWTLREVLLADDVSSY